MGWGRTVVWSEDEFEEAIETEEVEEVPGEGGYPSDVHLRGFNSSLEHGFESKSHREWQFD